MGRNRAEGKAEQRRVQDEVRRAEIYKQARAWFFRGFMAWIVAAPLAFLAPFFATCIALVGLACVVQGTRIAMRAPAGQPLREPGR